MNYENLDKLLNSTKTYTEGFKEGLVIMGYTFIKMGLTSEEAVKNILRIMESGNSFNQEQFKDLVEFYDKYTKEIKELEP